MRKHTQEDTVLHHLQNIGALSQMDAAYRYNIWRLAAVVHLLRKRHVINKSMVRHKAGGRYAVYRMEGTLGSPQNVMHVAQAAPIVDSETAADYINQMKELFKIDEEN